MKGRNDWERGPGRLRRWLAKAFPERQILVRTEGRVAHVRVSRHVQIALVSGLFLIGGWGVFTSVSYLIHDQVLAAKDGQIANARLAYKSLLGEVAEYQKKFKAITHDLEANHGLMLGLIEQNASLQKSLNQVERQLRTTEAEREQVIATRERLKAQLAEIEDNLRQLSNRNYALKDNLNSTEADLQAALAERNQALFESNRMRRHIRELESRLVELQTAQEESIRRLSERTLAHIDTMERVIQTAGLDVEALLRADKSRTAGQGGPFIAAGADDLPGHKLRSDLGHLDMQISRWEALQGLMQKLPLAPPLAAYYITSGYGKRRDPINGKWAAHYGVDLGNVPKSPVYATAPGVVTFAGYQGKYGVLVEIDHGAGLKTRYGHLNKALVKKGQQVAFQDTIGLLGNSGRSTGTHVHYEVLFHGKPKNPMNFFKAGRHVFQE